jgi:alkanesulfonate monooxygenase SsuD/methylene tetrahydromethanopterin reductase-like flavin-dependent oxidoreductase (luciferase family)
VDVKVGLFLTNQQPPQRDQVAALDEQLQMVRLAREHGWDSLFAGQHHLSESLAHIQPLPYLGRLTAEAGGMRIGIGIHLLALHNPVDTAESYASLDIVSRGRLTFGVGLGYRAEEYEAFGAAPENKVRRLQENLRIVEALWRGEKVDSDLPWCRLRGAELNLQPVQRPRPPIWMAANSDTAVRRAARMADTWVINPHATIETITRQLDIYRTTRATDGKGEPDELPAIREIFCAPTRQEALERAQPYLAEKYRIYSEWGQDKVMPDHESFQMPYEQLARGRFIVGTPDDCLEQLMPWRDQLGVNHFLFRTDWMGMPATSSQASVELLAREVVPVLKNA